MAATVTYTTVNGEILHENRGGVESFYVPDPLGNTAMLVDTSGAVTDTWNYWPYGEVQEHGGSSETPFTYVGASGYYTDNSGSIYIRARELEPELTRWLTLDKKWPANGAYTLVNAMPTILKDPSGNDASGWPAWFKRGNQQFGAPTFDCLDTYANANKNPKCQKALGGTPLEDVMICIIGCENRSGPSSTDPWAYDPGYGPDNPGGTGPARVNCPVHSEFRKRFPSFDSNICQNIRVGIQILCECLERNGGNIGGCGTGAKPNGGYDVISEPPGDSGSKNCFYQCMGRLAQKRAK